MYSAGHFLLKEMYSVYEGKKVNYRKDEIATSQGDMRRLWELCIALWVTGLKARPGTTPPTNLRP